LFINIGFFIEIIYISC